MFFKHTPAHYGSGIFVTRIKQVLRHFNEICKHFGSDQTFNREEPATFDFRSNCPQYRDTLVSITWPRSVRAFLYF